MNYADYRISLDVRSIGSHVALECKKRETKIRIYAVLTEGVKPYAISENCTAVFTAKKPDGNILFNDCVIEDNTIIYTFTQQTTTAVGVMDCEIRLYGPDNGLLISANFRVLVHDAVYDDDDVVESVTEVSTLTRLIGEATTLIAEVNASLENGDFIPKLEIGTVTTLPAGSNATVTITGPANAPVLNFGIPQGNEGQAESLIPDTELSTESTRPVQNKVIAEAIDALAGNIDTLAENNATAHDDLASSIETVNRENSNAHDVLAAAIEKVDSDNTESLNALAEEVADKVGKEDGKALSTNDFTDEYKQKLDGIEAGANKYVLGDGAVTAGKIANGAVSTTYTATVDADWSGSEAPYSKAITIPGLLASDNPIIDLVPSSTFADAEAQIEAWGYVYRAVTAANTLTLYATEKPTVSLPIQLKVVRK